jgi:tetratricopeptide (TPR) repeat protein
MGSSELRLESKRFDDPMTLLAVLRAGTLSQRRAAIRRFGELLEQDGGLSSDQLREIEETLARLRDAEIAHELSAARLALPGAPGRQERSLRRDWERLVADMEQRIVAFWDGIGVEEPVAALPPDERVLLFSHVPDLPDTVLRHLTAIVESTDGVTDRRGRQALLAALRYAGDPRLVPSLRHLLQGGEADLAVPALRVLGHIDDPRVHAIIRAAYRRAVTDRQRVVAAGALALAGDSRGAEYVREILARGEPDLAAYALESLAHLGAADDYRLVSEALENPDPILVTAAVRTLGRIGDGRALVPLARLRERSTRSALSAEVEEAEAAVRARMELLGEEAPPAREASEAFDTAKMAALVIRRDPARIGLRARWNLLLGGVWLLVGVLGKAVARFEAAASIRPDWVVPVLAVAMANVRRGKTAQALAAFRRALEIDRAAVEQNPANVRALARSFLRRAEEMERHGREDIAYGLLEEVLAIDLRKAPSGLRVALNQRHEQLRVRKT